MYLDETGGNRYCLQDLTLDELHALKRAIENTHLPDKGKLERIRRHLNTIPKL